MEKIQKKLGCQHYEAEKVMSWVFAGRKPTAKDWQWYHGLTQQAQAVYLSEQERICRQRNIQIITRNDSEYPEIWRQDMSVASVLYVQGNLAHLRAEPRVSIVGSRRPSEYSQIVAKQLSQLATMAGYTLISGMAQGIDSLVHQSALAVNGTTIAILGFGHDYCYPQTNEHFQLKRQLGRTQVVISQYPPMTPPAKWRFIERNLLIATLAPATIVIQAQDKSGSLITAEMALEAGRDVYIVTGVFGDDSYRGGHRLIDEGAIALQYFEQILPTS